MVHPLKKSTALVTLILLLLAQSLPAFDICVCEVPQGKSCCQRAAEPIAEPSCCSSQHSSSSNMHTAASETPSLTAGTCQRQTVTAETSIAALPTVWDTKTTQSAVGVLSMPVVDAVGFNPRLTLRTPATPCAHAPPIFLLNATIRA